MSGDYKQALEKHINSLSYFEKAGHYHNTGNDIFKIGEHFETTEEKLSYYKNALISYKKSLSILNSEDTEENYNYVFKKIQELEETQQDQSKKEEEEKESGKSRTNKEENQDIKENGSNEEQNDGSSNNNDREGEESSGYKGGEKNGAQLSDQEKKDLEAYIKYLQAQEQKNQKFFNKKSSGQELNDFGINPFTGEPFFDEVFDRGGEKDW